MFKCMDKLKIKLNLKNLALLLVVIYSVVVIFLVARDDGFYGIRFLSIWSIVIMWLLIVFLLTLVRNLKIRILKKLKSIKILEYIMLVCF